MTSNKLKIIACMSMVCDHVGYLMFPKVMVLRYIGRLAFPIFAFFIAEGCRHTRSKTKYLLQMLALAIGCQLFYIGESVINGGIDSIYCNVLFTFCLSIVVCAAYLRLVDDVKAGHKQRLLPNAVLCIGAVCFAVFCCTALSKLCGIPIIIDYGIAGVFLPLSAILFTDKMKKFICFCIGTVLFCAVYCLEMEYSWFALLSLVPIAFYNGARGSKKLKWAFYVFYPLHLAILYGISLLV